jgi:hypothetical protein
MQLVFLFTINAPCICKFDRIDENFLSLELNRTRSVDRNSECMIMMDPFVRWTLTSGIQMMVYMEVYICTPPVLALSCCFLKKFLQLCFFSSWTLIRQLWLPGCS